ncbi:MAG: hypothetical protein Q4P15_12150 [Propionibacteriaceae bacterium]|nr:hypothetical protein [Propionibacteriaceae bacterium]
MHHLSSDDLRRSRLHLFWVQALLSATVLGMIIWEIVRPLDEAAELTGRDPFGSFAYAASGLQITVLALLVTVWIAPRLTLLWMAPVAWLLPLTGVGMPTFWSVLAVVCIVVLAWMLRRSWRAEPHGPRQRFAVEGDFEDSFAFRRARLGWAIMAGAVVLTIGLLVAHHVAVAETLDFEERASRELAEVIGYDDDNVEMVVRVGSREITVDEPLWDTRPEVGELVPVLQDPQDPGRLEFVAEPQDPSWLLGLAFAAPLPGLGWGLPIILRSRRRRGLAQVGGASSTVVLTRSLTGDYEILPVDGSSPLLKVVTMEGVIPVAAFLHDGPQSGEADDELTADEDDYDDDTDDDEPLPEHDWELAAWADGSKREMDEWDSELASHDFSNLDADARSLAEAELGPDIADRELFTMVGSWGHGSTVALVRESGQVWLAELREPRFRADDRALFPPKSERRVFPPHWGNAWFRRRTESLAEWAHPNFQWLRWVVALGSAAVGAAWVGGVLWYGLHTVWDGWDWFRLVAVTVGLLVWPAILASSLPAPDVGRVRPGVAFFGFFLDDVIAPDRLVTVIAGDEAVALRLRDPEDAIMLHPEQLGDGLNASQAAHELRSWFLAAPTTARSGLRPSAGLVGVLAMVGAWALLSVAFLT